MRHEQEHQPRPAWQQTLTDFQRTRERFLREPNNANLIFTKVFHERLMAELTKPGLFELGRLLATPGSLEELERSKQVVEEFLIRHKHGDWGDLGDEDKQLNVQAIEEGSRIFSAYNTRREGRLYVITEWDRSATTVLRVDEY